MIPTAIWIAHGHRPFGMVSGARVGIFLLVSLMSEPLLALSCNEEITLHAGTCVQQTGLQNAASCRRNAVQACNCDQSIDQCRGSGPCDPALQAKAKINVDWVFADRGATNTYNLHRQMGESAFEAVVSAQAHNPPVQNLLRQCRPWVEAYLKTGGGCTLGNRAPGPNDCGCISVTPSGEYDPTGMPIYQVSSSCPDGFNVSVGFVDAAVSTGSSASWGQPRLVCPSQSYHTRPPQTFQIPSITGMSLQNAAGNYSCICRAGICN